ncbi:MAG: helix-turn-helix domain-containing protein [Coriobacteriales bacterium]|jgi:DNA-binding XRE family transcriptional regulator|nr:helix-turn-helix domain-containing protein [Coriobacteriales bacterium]
MKDRFHLSKAENVFLAKKRWPDSIYSGMRMENRNVTFPQTQTILAGVNVAGVSLDDIQAILNMRDAWRYLLGSLDTGLTVAYLCELQKRVAYREALSWGSLRDGAIGISGVRCIPPVPKRGEAESELEGLLAAPVSQTHKALATFCWIARSQLFWDGNKRTAMLAANKLLIEAGAGILLVADASMPEFSELLSAFYESGDPDELQGFLYRDALYGMDTALSPPSAAAPGGPRTASWLKAQRKAKGLTQKELAAVIGVAPNTLANIEQGQRKGSTEVWQKIEQELLT